MILKVGQAPYVCFTQLECKISRYSNIRGTVPLLTPNQMCHEVNRRNFKMCLHMKTPTSAQYTLGTRIIGGGVNEKRGLFKKHENKMCKRCRANYSVYQDITLFCLVSGLFIGSVLQMFLFLLKIQGHIFINFVLVKQKECSNRQLWPQLFGYNTVK